MADGYRERYRELREVGVGNYGKKHTAVAVLVESVADKRKLVAKKIEIGLLKEKERTAVLAEVTFTQAQILRTLKHFNIVSYEDSFLSASEFIILMEYCEGGDLAQVLQEATSPFPESQVLNWLAQISLALNYLHHKHILHRDIKPSNVYLTSTHTIKLGDFGIAKVLEHSSDLAFSLAGTPNYMSPEVIRNEPYSQKSDVWALGCVLFEMCERRRAFVGRNIISLMGVISNEEPSPLPQGYSQGVKKLVE